MSSESRTDVLLIGGGIAAASAARALREGGFDGSVVLATRELDAPYHRPPGSKEHLRGEQDQAEALILPEGWWEENAVDLRLRTGVLSLDAGAKVAKLQTKEELAFGRALVATGAMVRRLSVDGSGLEGIHYLRSLRNSDTIRGDLADAAEAEPDGRPRVVLVGGSYIGCEVAASLTATGTPATILMQESEPLERTFGSEIGRWVRSRLEAGGVEVRGGVDVVGFRNAEGGDGEGRVASVVLADGTAVAADIVVAGVGAQPDAMLAKRAGLELGESGGIRCDDRLRTSAAGIWAAGDICEYDSVLHGERVRIEHEEAAAAQGAYVARQWLGEDAPFAEVPYFFSDLADWVSFESLGPARRWDRTVIQGSLDEDRFAVWFLEGDRARGYASFNGGGDLDAARAVLQAGESVDAAALGG
ncbi:ferredoxin reductase [Patulibacter medicamentivorans]|uniref:Ferredoxin reductase n=1 Tax=Patulibacter medicamentivorans TaxID=1097667 RepID=H0EBN8_9ACTN|nr:FAD-dependent oxidoreductase [Patulibacter medicamentivorans]EHN08900.1 ferredoxin reductase [Patulibacter medicamentivorans]